MKRIYLSALYLFLPLFLSSCHPSDNGTSSGHDSLNDSFIHTLEGKVVDGYISGAQVCFEHNESSVCQTSDSNGSYQFQSIEFEPNQRLTLRASGGIDTATQKNYVGSLLHKIDLQRDQESIYITPLGDLVALSTDTNSSLEQARDQIAQAYGVDSSLLLGDPMVENTLFAATQELENTKKLLLTLATKLEESSLTQGELEVILGDIRASIATEVLKSQSIDLDKVLVDLETKWDRSIPVNLKSFVIAQRLIYKEALNNFIQDPNLNLELRSKYQNALATKTESILQSFVALPENIFLTPQAIDIDVYAIDDDNTSSEDQNSTDDLPLDETQDHFTLEGIVVDGYIEGATVCIDSNDNRICDANEARTLSDSNGSFHFSDVVLFKEKYFRIMAFGGFDTATQKAFESEYYAVVDTHSQESTLILSPLSDLVTRMFFRSSTFDAAALDFANSQVAASLGILKTQLMQDPYTHKDLLLISQEIESIYKIFAATLEEMQTSSLTSNQKKVIRESILEQYLESGRSSFDVARALIRIEVKLGINLPHALRTFAIDQIADLQAKLYALGLSLTLEATSYHRVQELLEEQMELILSGLPNVHDIKLSETEVLYSIFDKTGASYDENACIQNNIYIYSHTQSSDEERYTDTNNGIMMGFDSEKNTQLASFTLFYPSLGEVPQTDRQIRFESDYYFSYNSAWIETEKSIYLQAPQESSGLYRCYKIKLDQLYGSYLFLEPVYRYTDPN